MTTQHDFKYFDLLNKIINEGVKKDDRTGVGTISTFGHEMTFDLSDGSIPLLTTKKMHLPSIIHELLWYISGSSNIQYLKDNGVRIWNEWASPDGHLNYVYGYQWRRWPVEENEKCVLVPIMQFDYDGGPRTFDDKPTQEIYDYEKCAHEMWLELIKQGMMYICKEWLSFNQFLIDIKDIPGFMQWKKTPNQYTLSKQYYNCNVYSKNTCVFITKSYSYHLDNDYNPITQGRLDCKYTALFPLTKEYHESVSLNTLSDMINERVTSHHYELICQPEITTSNGWIVKKISPPQGYVYRKQVYIDQLGDVINRIKTNPDCRRLIVNAWNVGLIDEMKLPPCHYTFQFYVAEGKLSLKLTQRSCDAFLGVPFNIAQYSLLLHIVAHITGLKPHKFIWSGGDCHIYNNCMSQVVEQLSRDPYDSPTISFKREVTSIDNLQYDDIIVNDYNYHPAIKAVVAV